jgi:hypothetical protein
LTLEDGADNLCRNVANYQSTLCYVLEERITQLHSYLSNRLDTWKRVLLEKLTVPQLLNKYAARCDANLYCRAAHKSPPLVTVLR